LGGPGNAAKTTRAGCGVPLADSSLSCCEGSGGDGCAELSEPALGAPADASLGASPATMLARAASLATGAVVHRLVAGAHQLRPDRRAAVRAARTASLQLGPV